MLSLSEGNVLVQSPYMVTDQAGTSNIQNLAEDAVWEYSETMKDLESKMKEESEMAKETEVDDVGMGEFIDYINELCNKKSVAEVKEESYMLKLSVL